MLQNAKHLSIRFRWRQLGRGGDQLACAGADAPTVAATAGRLVSGSTNHRLPPCCLLSTSESSTEFLSTHAAAAQIRHAMYWETVQREPSEYLFDLLEPVVSFVSSALSTVTRFSNRKVLYCPVSVKQTNFRCRFQIKVLENQFFENPNQRLALQRLFREIAPITRRRTLSSRSLVVSGGCSATRNICWKVPSSSVGHARSSKCMTP